MTQPINIIEGSLRSIGALAAGETADPNAANDALVMLNDMLDAWSNERMLLYCVQEVIHELTANQYIYTIGDQNSSVACTFTGTSVNNVLTVTAILTGALSVGQVVFGNGVQNNTIITAYGTGQGGNGSGALGTYYLSLNPTGIPVTYGSYALRPLRINSAFVRVVTSPNGPLDYPIAILNLENYESIGLKALPGPWPRALYYQPSEPVGIINYWPNPSQGEMHLFCDMLLNRFQTINDTVTLPQGYLLALRFNLAELLMPEYGKADPQQVAMIREYASAGRAAIRRTNMQPVQTVRFDDVLIAGRRKDAGWILHGGFN